MTRVLRRAFAVAVWVPLWLWDTATGKPVRPRLRDGLTWADGIYPPAIRIGDRHAVVRRRSPR
ncbi:hypothetical protein [Catenuloplanes japonicus]|uniref:hypothetical protein n=1 Tax=Catenuloplanes japonicus TaxID=33876 RepID=UPI000525401A|nr:hypothetical protein [Catenuloplanes japonicus]